MNNLRVGQLVWLNLFEIPRDEKYLLRIMGIVWSVKHNTVLYKCSVLKTDDPKVVTTQILDISSKIMKEAILAEDNLQLLYGYKED